MKINDRLAELGILLPSPARPVASYVPTVLADGLLHVSGQLPFRADGTLIRGRLGETLKVEHGVEAARACAVMILAQANAALGDLGAVKQVVKLGVFVNSSPSFTDQPVVANGASDLVEAIFGLAGRHARSAVGVSTLPLGVAVEIDAILSVR